MAHRSLTVLVAAVVMAPLILLPAPAHAFGPNDPVQINQVQVFTSALDGTQVPSNGEAQVRVSAGFNRCSAGQCSPWPTLTEVTVYENADSCEGVNCRVPAGARWGRYWVNTTIPEQDRPAIPTLASMGLTGLRPGSLLGIRVRLYNGVAWSNSYTNTTLRVAAAANARDTVPVNLAPPELGSYVGNRIPTPELANDSWLTMWSVGRWGPGAVSTPFAVRVQSAQCRDAACTLTDDEWGQVFEWNTKICQFPGDSGRLLANSDQRCGLNPQRYVDAATPCWRARAAAQNAAGWSAWVESAPKCIPGQSPGGGSPANPAADPAAANPAAANPAANPAADPAAANPDNNASAGDVNAALAVASGFDSAATPVVAAGSVNASGLSLSLRVPKTVKRGKKFATTLTVSPAGTRGGMRQYVISMTGGQPRVVRSSRGFISQDSRTKKYWISPKAARGAYIVLSTFRPSTPGMVGLSLVTPITVK
jgi:hypothetical protein